MNLFLAFEYKPAYRYLLPRYVTIIFLSLNMSSRISKYLIDSKYYLFSFNNDDSYSIYLVFLGSILIAFL